MNTTGYSILQTSLLLSRRKMFIVAVTGGIASGKSTVSRVFERNGIPVVDADKIAREIVQPGKKCWYQIREVFGDEVFHANKELNREALGRIIFNDRELRGKLNQITHKVIHRTIFIEVFKHFISGRSWIVLDLPLLFETGVLMDFIYKIITVSCDPETQLKRLIERNELSEEDARRRIESQMPLEQKCERSHFVIDNTGSLEDTEAAALQIISILKDSNQHWRNRAVMFGIVLAIGFLIYFLNKVLGFLPNFLSFSN